MQKLYLILYRLNQPEQNYPELYEAIEDLGEARHLNATLTSAWMVMSAESAYDITDTLLTHIDDDDGLLVTEMTDNYSGWLDREDLAWIEWARASARLQQRRATRAAVRAVLRRSGR